LGPFGKASWLLSGTLLAIH